MALPRIGFIGTGIMGASLVKHLLKAKYAVTVFNRSPAKTASLVELGAEKGESPRAVAMNSDVLFLMVGFPADVSKVLFEDGALAALSRGSLLCDLTTSSPSLAVEVFEKAKAKGVQSLDAPVTGGDVGAREARLTMLVGGDKDAFGKAEAVFKLWGTPIYMGGPGAGQLCKAANQITIATGMIGVVEGLLFAHEAGLDLDTYLRAIRNGGAASRSLDLYGPRLLKGDLQPGFLVKHFVKDLGLALDEAKRMNLALPGLALANQLYIGLQSHGEGELGTQALVNSLSRLSKVRAGAPWALSKV